MLFIIQKMISANMIRSTRPIKRFPVVGMLYSRWMKRTYIVIKYLLYISRGCNAERHSHCFFLPLIILMHVPSMFYKRKSGILEILILLTIVTSWAYSLPWVCTCLAVLLTRLVRQLDSEVRLNSVIPTFYVMNWCIWAHMITIH